MPNLVIMRWIPASWKSTIAKNLVEVFWYKRVNKDSLRNMIDLWKFSITNEWFIDQCELAIADIYLSEWFNVVIDDTNIAPSRVNMLWENLVYDWEKVNVIINDLNTPLNVCLERDRKRWKERVWDNVITDIYNKKQIIDNIK